MNNEEREIVKKFERLYLKDFNNEKITNEDRLSYIECALMSNLIEKLQKENEELKEKENKIYKEVHESLAFEKFLIVKERKPDLFNQGRFYISQIIYDILNDVQNPEGIHKENKCIQYIDYIPVQKVKDKIEELKQERDETYTKFLGGNRTDENLSTRGKMIEGGIKVLQELLEESEE